MVRMVCPPFPGPGPVEHGRPPWRSGPGPRGLTPDEARVGDPFAATRRVVEQAFQRLGIPTVLGQRRGFVNVDAEFLMTRLLEALPRERVVLEILGTVEADARILRRCRELKAMQA
jgi:c-di-GMP-related signal transduction protein